LFEDLFVPPAVFRVVELSFPQITEGYIRGSIFLLSPFPL